MSADANTPIPPLSEQLGKAPISRYMSNPPYAATPTTTVRTAMKIMLTHKVSGLPIVDDSNVILGVYTEMDALLQGASQSLDSPIRYVKPPLCLFQNNTFKDALVLLVSKRIKRIPVVDQQRRLIGIVSRADLMQALYDDQAKKD
jgi:IMP dehydrogenase